MPLLYSNERASELQSLASLEGGKLPESRTGNLRGMSYDEQRAALAPVQLKQAGPAAPQADAPEQDVAPEKDGPKPA